MASRAQRYRQTIESRRRSAGRDRLLTLAAVAVFAGLAVWQGLARAGRGAGVPSGPYLLSALDTDDRPLAGIALKFFRPDGSTDETFEAVTDDQGKVLLPEDRWTGDWICQGRTAAGVLSQGALNRYEPRRGEIRFGPTAPIVGRVANDLGAPLADVELEVRHRMREGPVLARVRSDEEGRFRLVGLSDSLEALRFRCRVEGYTAYDAELECPPGEEVLLELEASIPLRVRVLDPEGLPCPGSKVALLGVKDCERSCGADGVAEFRGLSPRWSYKVLVEAEGLTYRQPQDLGPSSRVHEIRLERPQTLLGRVLDGEGRPVYGLELRHAYGNQGVVSTRTGAGGRFHIGGLPSGRVELVYDLPNGRTGRFAVVSGGGEVLLRLDS